MKIEKIYLKNFRGIQSLELNISEQLNVFYGMNGAGKSTVLDALAIGLSWVVNRMRSAGASGRSIVESDIMNGASFSKIEIHGSADGKAVPWSLVKKRKGRRGTEEKSSLKNLNEYTAIIQTAIDESNEEINLPLFAYYPVNRAVLDIPLRIREKHRFNLLAAYDGSLTSGASFRTFFEWFREREDLENENRKYIDAPSKPDDFQFPDPQLATVRRALTLFLPEFTDFSIRRNPLRMEVFKNNKRLTVNQLSDGEKCLIALVGDLARRLAIVNPERDDALLGEGIILIDEIDLHLHPAWQRMVVSNLVKVFPHCQFIISTHSPHVLAHVEPNNLFLLQQGDDGVTVEKPIESYGKNVDRVLEDLMGLETTRPTDVEIQLQAIFNFINAGEIQPAKQAIHVLRKSIGDDPELVKAEVLIKRRELIGR